MEVERKKEKKNRQISKKRTAFNIKEEKNKKAAEDRENNSALMALYTLFLPNTSNHGRPKFITDKYGNRVRSGMENKEKEK